MFQIKKNIFFFIKLLIFLGSFIYLYYYIDFNSFFKILDAKNIFGNYLYLIIFFLLSLLNNIFNLERFKIICRHFIKKKIKKNDFTQIIFYSSLASEAGSAFLVLARYLLSKKINLNLKNNFFVILVEKFLSLLFFVIYFCFFMITIDVFFVFSVFLLIFFLYTVTKTKIYEQKIKYFKGKYLAFIYSFLIQIVAFAQLYLCVKIMNLELSYYQIFFVIPGLILLSSLSPTFTDWGYREFIFVIILDFFSFLKEEAFLLSLLFGLLTLISSFLLVVFFEVKLYLSKLKNL